MVVVEICLSKSWGGLEHYCADSAKRLASRGHSIVAVVCPDSPLHHKLNEYGIPVYAFRPAVDYLCPVTAVKLAHLFRKHSITAIHLHRTQDLGTELLAADLAGVGKRVFTLQMESSRRKRDIYHRWAYSRLTKVLTITERMRKLVIKNVAVDPEKVETLYYGIDTKEIRSHAEPKETIRERWNIPADTFVVGIVGRLEKQKGQELLLQACAKLKDKIPNLRLMIVGDETVGQSGELQRLKKFANELSLADQVVFTGYQNPPGVIVPVFDVSVLATRKETFGLVILEAMALGVPVIATNAGGVPEIIEDGVNGLLVTPDDSGALAKALMELYEKVDLRQRLATAGKQAVETRFSIEAQVVGLERALSEA